MTNLSSEQVIEVVGASLETCAEQAGDITSAVYEHFFTHCPNAIPLMGHSDDGMKGRMLAQVFELLLTDEHLGDDGYLRWEVDNHVLAYGVEVDMYPGFLQAVADTVKSSLGDAWSVDHAQAWSTRVATLLADISAHAEPSQRTAS